MSRYTESARERLARQINTAPEPLRSHVISLETICDPSGDLQRLAFLRDTCEALLRRIRELEGEAPA